MTILLQCRVCCRTTSWVYEEGVLKCWSCGRPSNYKGLCPKYTRF